MQTQPTAGLTPAWSGMSIHAACAHSRSTPRTTRPPCGRLTSSPRKTRSSAPSCFRNYITLASTSAAMRYTPSTSISADSGTRTGIHRTNDRSLSCFMTGTVLRTRVQQGAGRARRAGRFPRDNPQPACASPDRRRWQGCARLLVRPSYDLVHPLRAAHQLFPESFGLAHDERRVGLEHVPRPLFNLAAQLARLPRHEAGDEPRVLGLRFDDAVYDCGVEGGEQSRQHLE